MYGCMNVLNCHKLVAQATKIKVDNDTPLSFPPESFAELSNFKC